MNCKETTYEIVALYKSHNNTFSNLKNNLTEILSKISVNKVINIGDVNINITQNNNDTCKFEYLNLIARMVYYSRINKPIRENNAHSSIIDNIFI